MREALRQRVTGKELLLLVSLLAGSEGRGRGDAWLSSPGQILVLLLQGRHLRPLPRLRLARDAVLGGDRDRDTSLSEGLRATDPSAARVICRKIAAVRTFVKKLPSNHYLPFVKKFPTYQDLY